MEYLEYTIVRLKKEKMKIILYQYLIFLMFQKLLNTSL